MLFHSFSSTNLKKIVTVRREGGYTANKTKKEEKKKGKKSVERISVLKISSRKHLKTRKKLRRDLLEGVTGKV